VRRRGGRGEDDGYLVSFVYDRAEKRSEMVVVDCRDFSASPVARVLLPQRVPFGFHGIWLDGELL
jgi:carotenoid cleavage dioxygenase